jgi:hypothetical protein
LRSEGKQIKVQLWRWQKDLRTRRPKIPGFLFETSAQRGDEIPPHTHFPVDRRSFGRPQTAASSSRQQVGTQQHTNCFFKLLLYGFALKRGGKIIRAEKENGSQSFRHIQQRRMHIDVMKSNNVVYNCHLGGMKAPKYTNSQSNYCQSAYPSNPHKCLIALDSLNVTLFC